MDDSKNKLLNIEAALLYKKCKIDGYTAPGLRFYIYFHDMIKKYWLETKENLDCNTSIYKYLDYMNENFTDEFFENVRNDIIKDMFESY